MGCISPDAVTVCLSSGLTSSFTVTTSGSSLRVATTLMTTTRAITTATTAPIMIFFLRLNAILSFLFAGDLQILEDVSTWKLIKQFHLRANAIRLNLLTLRPQTSTKDRCIRQRSIQFCAIATEQNCCCRAVRIRVGL